MTALYRIRNKITDQGRPLLQVTIKTERHMFLDIDNLSGFTSIADVISEEERDIIQGPSGVIRLFSLMNDDRGFDGLLGLETSWQDISDRAADELISRFYSYDQAFAVHLNTSSSLPSLELSLGASNISLRLSKDQAEADKAALERLKEYCERNPPQNETDFQAAKDAAVDVGGVTGSIYGVGAACLEGAVVTRTPLGAALVCVGNIVLAVGTFLGFLKSQQEKQQRQNEMRDRETVCSSRGDFAGVDMDRMDRASRTA